MAVVTIDVEEGKHETYKAVEIHRLQSQKEDIVFDSGDFVKDWYLCNKKIITDLQEKEIHFSNSSSVDHFISDGAPYDSAYLCFDEDGGEPYLSYNPNDYFAGVEYFVKEGTQPTWDELRELCDDVKEKV